MPRTKYFKDEETPVSNQLAQQDERESDPNQFLKNQVDSDSQIYDGNHSREERIAKSLSLLKGVTGISQADIVNRILFDALGDSEDFSLILLFRKIIQEEQAEKDRIFLLEEERLEQEETRKMIEWKQAELNALAHSIMV